MTFHNTTICAFRPDNEENQNQEKTIHYLTIQLSSLLDDEEDEKRRGEIRP